MKFKDITKLFEKEHKTLMEFSDINTDKYAKVKSFEDFMKICGNFVGYEVRELSSEEATDINVECIYGLFPDEVAEWLEENHDDKVRKLCKKPSCEEITLLSVERNLVWEQDNKLAKDEFVAMMEKLQPLEDEFYKELEAEEESRRAAELKRQQEIDALIEGYKKDYKAATLVKDKDAILSELSGKLQSKFGIDGRGNPNYRKPMLKVMLES